MVAQTVVMATIMSELSKKPWTTIFDHFIPFVQPIQHYHTTQHPILHQAIKLSWWHKPSLWQQWHHNYRKKLWTTIFDHFISYVPPI